ncbi:MAG: hypothetical protein DYG96_00840 [Chlorobi bacterium CHB2]|nr:hypothetical protein [Chlorobi bacterium CHB2]
MRLLFSVCRLLETVGKITEKAPQRGASAKKDTGWGKGCFPNTHSINRKAVVFPPIAGMAGNKGLKRTMPNRHDGF